MNNDVKIKKKMIALVMIRLFLLSGIFSIFFLIPRATRAADFSFVYPPRIGLNQEFQVDFTVNTQVENINAIEGKIIYDSQLLSLEEVRVAGTVVSLWVTDPVQDKNNGELEFSGITPGGFNTADQAKNVFSLIFKSLKEGQTQVQTQDLIALLNDGLGTNAKVTVSKTPIITIDSSAAANPVPVIEDTDLPEPPFLEIIQDPSIENGRWVAVFYGQDKKSGVNHYEIAEQPGEKVSDYSGLTWRQARSPQMLADQSRGSVVYLKVVDNAGNERIITISPARTSSYKKIVFWCIIVLALLLLLYFGRFVWRKTKHFSIRIKK